MIGVLEILFPDSGLKFPVLKLTGNLSEKACEISALNT